MKDIAHLELSRVVAPMVGQSDLAFRLLCRYLYARAFGRKLCCYTEMFYADQFVHDEEYRNTYWQTCDVDHPIIVQFCGHDSKSLADATRLVSTRCDAIDLNLGCPQDRAREGRYGSYLLEKKEWPVVSECVEAMVEASTIPILAKIRLLPTMDETLQFVNILERCGVTAICVHGRKRGSSKRRREGPADLDAIRTISTVAKVPIICNGNIANYQDLAQNESYTSSIGVMSAETILSNPGLFAHESMNDAYQAYCRIELYLRLATTFPPPKFRYVQDHVSNMLGRSGRGRQTQYLFRGKYKPLALKKEIFENAQSIDDLRELVETVFSVYFDIQHEVKCHDARRSDSFSLNSSATNDDDNCGPADADVPTADNGEGPLVSNDDEDDDGPTAHKSAGRLASNDSMEANDGDDDGPTADNDDDCTTATNDEDNDGPTATNDNDDNDNDNDDDGPTATNDNLEANEDDCTTATTDNYGLSAVDHTVDYHIVVDDDGPTIADEDCCTVDDDDDGLDDLNPTDTKQPVKRMSNSNCTNSIKSCLNDTKRSYSSVSSPNPTRSTTRDAIHQINISDLPSVEEMLRTIQSAKSM